MIRLGDIAHVTRGHADPPQPLFRVNGQDGIGLAIAMRDGRRRPGPRAQHRAGDGGDHGGPAGRDRADPRRRSARDRRAAVDEFMKALWEAVAIVLAVSLISLGLRRAPWWRSRSRSCSPSCSSSMAVFGHRPAADLARRLIIALGLLVDDAMITVETMVTGLDMATTRSTPPPSPTPRPPFRC